MKRHFPFLKQVFIHSVTAFGGPQAHLGMMSKTFVEGRRDITNEELLEYNSFCNLLPGASSTQMLTLIGYKRGGISLALLTLCIWILPAFLLMSFLSFMVINQDINAMSFLKFMNPMAVSFLVYAAINSFQTISKNTIVYIIILLTSCLIIFGFKQPWIFPFVIISSGLVTCISKKRIPDEKVKSRKIVWSNLWLFVVVFVLAGFFSELARKQNWDSSLRKPLNLFENTYRMGSVVFGGGQVLIPMMESQFCERFSRQVVQNRNPDAIEIDKAKFFVGAGIVRAIPGPVFSISAFVGGLALNEGGMPRQLFGCFIGSIGIFLPSALLVFFFFPVWNNLKTNAIVYRALEGINASVVGIMVGSCIYMFLDILNIDNQYINLFNTINVVFIIAILLILKFTKIPAPVIVLLTLLLGVLF